MGESRCSMCQWFRSRYFSNKKKVEIASDPPSANDCISRKLEIWSVCPDETIEAIRRQIEVLPFCKTIFRQPVWKRRIRSRTESPSDMASGGVTAPTENISPPTIGGNYDLDDAIVAGQLIWTESADPPINRPLFAALPIPDTQVLSAHCYGGSLWGRTAKIMTQLPDGEKKTYFLKVRYCEMVFFPPPPVRRV